MVKAKYIKSGGWRTVEWFFNSKGRGAFSEPSGAQIKVRYGLSFLGKDRQKKKLNGKDVKVLNVGRSSIFRARMQIKVPKSTDVTYEIVGSGIAFQYFVKGNY